MIMHAIIVEALRDENGRLHAELAKRHTIYIEELPETQKTARLLFAVLNRLERELHEQAKFQRSAYQALYERIDMNPALQGVETALTDLQTDVTTVIGGLRTDNAKLTTDNATLQAKVTDLQAQIDSGAHLADDATTLTGEIRAIKDTVDGVTTVAGGAGTDTTVGATGTDPVTGQPIPPAPAV